MLDEEAGRRMKLMDQPGRQVIACRREGTLGEVAQEEVGEGVYTW